MSEILSFSETRAHFARVLDRVSRERARFVVTRNGHPVAVLLSPEELEGIEETIALLSDDEARASLRRAAAEDEAGLAQTVAFDEARSWIAKPA